MSEIQPNDAWGHVSYVIQACLGLWLALLGPMARPNSPTGGLSLPPASHPPLPSTPPPPIHPFPITRHQWWEAGGRLNPQLQWF